MATIEQIINDPQFGAQAKVYLDMGMPEVQIIGLFGRHIDNRIGGEFVSANIVDTAQIVTPMEITPTGQLKKIISRDEKLRVALVIVIIAYRKGKMSRQGAKDFIVKILMEMKKK